MFLFYMSDFYLDIILENEIETFNEFKSLSLNKVNSEGVQGQDKHFQGYMRIENVGNHCNRLLTK